MTDHREVKVFSNMISLSQFFFICNWKFKGIDIEKIQKAAVKIQGGSGPSDMDLDGLKQI